MNNCNPFLQNRIERIIGDYSVAGEDESVSVRPCALGYLRDVRPVTQNGPQCGLVALKMAMDALTGTETLSPEAVLEEAQRIGVSNHGEMFSVDWLAGLSSTLYPSRPATVVEVSLLGDKTKSFILDCLLSSKCLLVPYDADKNHEPCLNNGHSAHWALVVGFLIDDSSIPPSFDASCQCVKRDCSLLNLYWCNIACSSDLCNRHQCHWLDLLSCVDSDTGQVHVFALHGKSRRVAVWQLDKLLISNANLREIGPKRLADGLEYRVPDEGVQGGLAGKFLMLE